MTPPDAITSLFAHLTAFQHSQSPSSCQVSIFEPLSAVGFLISSTTTVTYVIYLQYFANGLTLPCFIDSGKLLILNYHFGVTGTLHISFMYTCPSVRNPEFYLSVRF